MSNREIPFALALAGALLLAGCAKPFHPRNPGVATSDMLFPQTQETPAESNKVVRSFIVNGVIRELPLDGRSARIQHENIPALMPPMTMEFNVRGNVELKKFRVGDAITFQLDTTPDESWVSSILLRSATNGPSFSTSGQANTPVVPNAKTLKPGDLLPDAELVAEDGRIIKLSEFQGRAVALTFVFTRCLMPDFCPRMNHQFQRARALLQQHPVGPTNWMFLSISFDPEFDQPEVLTRYAVNYRGEDPDRWLFAAAPASVMQWVSTYLDFHFANESGSFVHNLRTVVLDPNRRVYRQFDGNKWKSEDLARAMVDAAANEHPLQSVSDAPSASR